MAKMTTEALLDVFKSMTLLELSEFLKAFEQEFGVTAAAPVVAPGVQDAPAVEAPDEQSEFDLVLESFGDKKIQVIKAMREIIPGLGLKEAKDLVEAAPKAVLEKVDKDVAEAARIKLEAAGARAALR
ncbi:50S ribosomal protein L7/L12 [Nocardia yamanashiensis]|uniref:50S ribosomal protein L7/L12 n=1 Tax=Nocardia yamanashiensis TaxID=209247 RepID=UPI001E64214B|nr:50S ribosomal protein L7/L12 [Nocardia yamanashiensis]UGT41475.1 50S ribosomal protein L7/L12 [Nocardia yamanashiensis]